jgi:hypothetical protein
MELIVEYIYQVLLLSADRNAGIVSIVVVKALRKIINDTKTLVQNAAELLEGSSRSLYNVFFQGFMISPAVYLCRLRGLAGRSLERWDIEAHAAELPPMEIALLFPDIWPSLGLLPKSSSLSLSDGTK